MHGFCDFYPDFKFLKIALQSKPCTDLRDMYYNYYANINSK